MTDQNEYRTISVPLPDTGIGQSLGFEDDQEMHDVAKAKREAMPEDMRRAYDEMAKADLREYILGD